MNGWLLAILLLVVLVAVGVILKITLSQRLRDIDGAVGVHKGEDVVIADLGDDEK